MGPSIACSCAESERLFLGDSLGATVGVCLVGLGVERAFHRSPVLSTAGAGQPASLAPLLGSTVALPGLGARAPGGSPARVQDLLPVSQLQPSKPFLIVFSSQR